MFDRFFHALALITLVCLLVSPAYATLPAGAGDAPAGRGNDIQATPTAPKRLPGNVPSGDTGQAQSKGVDQGLEPLGVQKLILYSAPGVALLLLACLLWNTRLRRQLQQQQHLRQELAARLHLMHAWINAAPYPAYVCDRDGRLQSCNDSYLETLAVSKEEIIGRSLLAGAVDDPGQVQEHHADCQRVINENSPLSLDRPLQLKERRLTVHHWVVPLHDAAGKLEGVVGGWLDISEHRHLADQLRAARQLGEQASQSDSTFLSSMGHEIRTPMNAVIGLLELSLQRPSDHPQQRPAIEMAHQSARETLDLIGDILDTLHLESGQLLLAPEWVGLHRLLESSLQEFYSPASQKGLKLIPVLEPEDEHREVLLDPLRFQQILRNLLSNALKFTEQGLIRITLQLQPTDNARQQQLELLVSDTGIGISEPDQRRLFTDPTRAHDDAGGAHLGLLISRRLCELMGGSLQLASQPDSGTQVRVLLPLSSHLSQKPPEPRVSAITRPTTALNILVVDDHPANRQLVCEQLEFLGHRCDTADDGVQGFHAWKDGDFDLLIADCRMPGMDGYELTRDIREHERQSGEAPCRIIGFTATVLAEDRTRCKQAGMDECLFKPVTLKTWSHTLNGLFSPTGDPSTDEDVFSLDALHNLTRGRPQFALRVLGELLKCSYRDRHALAVLPDEDGLQALGDIAHRIKGSALMVQARQLEQRCEALEQACLEGFDVQKLRPLRTALEQTMLHFERALLRQLDRQDAPDTP